MKMKTTAALIAALLILSACATTAQTNPDEVSLATAIRMAASRMETRLDAGTKVALINFTSPSQAFSEYVLDELSSVLVNNGQLVVVDRANLDRIRQELGFNSSGEVSDKSMQEIGLMLGAQALVTGSLTSIADLRRVMFKVIMTETAAVAVQHPADIINDRRVQALLASDARASAGGGSQGVAYGNANYGAPNSGSGNSNSGSGSGNTQAVPAQAQPTPAQPAGPQNGTYTFYPRLRITKSGTPENIYISHITVSNDFIVIYFAGRPQGEGDAYIYAGDGRNYMVHDLDNPSRSYNAVNRVSGGGLGSVKSASFRRFSATRFKLTMRYSATEEYVADEIILGEPDRE